MKSTLRIVGLIFAGWLVQGASCNPKPPQPPGLPCGGSCPPHLTCKDGQCVDACAGVTCPPGVPCRDGLCHAIPPPPVGHKYLDMLLRTCGTGQFCVDGKPVDHAGCEACCMAWEGGRSGWPLYSVEFADYCREKGRSTFLHARPGPFIAADEPEWAAIGGPYVEVGGKADLTRWNEPFWAELARIVDHAGSKGMWVEIDLIDSWRLKGGCDYSPWVKYRNIQGEDHCSNTHRGPGDAVHDAFLGKILATVGRFGNVVTQIGNESGLVAGKNDGLKQWERWVFERVRHHESTVGMEVVHMVGTNSEYDELEASWPDYINLHGQIPYEASYGKPTTNNETNRGSVMTCDWYLQQYCKARRGGAYLWLWRSEMSLDAWLCVLGSTSQARLTGCEGVPEPEACPYPVPPTHTISCKSHAPWQDGQKWDCTPKTTTGPVWPEGDPDLRSACEQKSMGGTPTYSLQGATGTLTLQPLGNKLQFALRGTGKATLHCSIPAAPGQNKCGYQVSR